MTEEDATGRLWAEYKESGDRQIRDQLIVLYSPLVKYVAARVALGATAPSTAISATSAAHLPNHRTCGALRRRVTRSVEPIAISTPRSNPTPSLGTTAKTPARVSRERSRI